MKMFLCIFPDLTSKIPGPVFFLLAKFCENSEKCDSDQYKGFFMGKMFQIHQISKRKKFKSPDFYNKFH
jgi:hypothetical protein